MKKNSNVRREPSFSFGLGEGKIKEAILENRSDNLLFTEDIEEDLSLHSFHECRFDKLAFLSDGQGCEFADVIFDHCDFSNISFPETVCRRVEFHNCRLTGTDFTKSVLEDVMFDSCECSYANFSKAKFKRCSFQNTRFLEGGFSECSFMHMDIDSCDFTGAEFYAATMKGLDFSTSRIDGILVSANDLRGVIVNEEQAVACAKLFGIVVK